ncbi:hypothetical protein Tco_0762771 [Tanacetum coccineum]
MVGGWVVSRGGAAKWRFIRESLTVGEFDVQINGEAITESFVDRRPLRREACIELPSGCNMFAMGPARVDWEPLGTAELVSYTYYVAWHSLGKLL